MRNKVDKVLGSVLSIIMAVMVVNVLWQVFTRFIIGTPSSFTDELARYLMIWVGILGAAYISGQGKHVAIELLPSKLSEKNRTKLGWLVHVIVLLFCFLVFVIGGSRLVYVTFILKQFSPALQIPLAAVYIVIPISGLLIMYYKISDISKIQH